MTTVKEEPPDVNRRHNLRAGVRHSHLTDRRRRPRDARVGRNPASRWRDRALIGKLIGRLACLNVTAKGAAPLGSHHPSAR